MIARKVGPHLGLQRRREETGVLHRRERQQQASVPNEFDPQHGQSPRIHSSTVKRIGEPAVKTVLAITKKRVYPQGIFSLHLQWLETEYGRGNRPGGSPL